MLDKETIRQELRDAFVYTPNACFGNVTSHEEFVEHRADLPIWGREATLEALPCVLEELLDANVGGGTDDYADQVIYFLNSPEWSAKSLTSTDSKHEMYEWHERFQRDAGNCYISLAAVCKSMAGLC